MLPQELIEHILFFNDFYDIASLSKVFDREILYKFALKHGNVKHSCELYKAFGKEIIYDIIERKYNKVSNIWSIISEKIPLCFEFIGAFEHQLDWTKISLRFDLTEKFIDKFRHLIHFNFVSMNYKLSDHIMNKYLGNCDKCYWECTHKFNTFMLCTDGHINQYNIHNYFSPINIDYALQIINLNEGNHIKQSSLC